MRTEVLEHEASPFELPVTLGLESDGTEELRRPECVCIVDHREHSGLK